MKALRALAIFSALTVTGPLKAEGTAAVRTELQAEMQRHIDRIAIDGVIQHLDLQSGALLELFPTEAHAMILIGDGYYVLCSDLVDANGTFYPADFYMLPTEGVFHVFRTEIDNRGPLEALMGLGGVDEL